MKKLCKKCKKELPKNSKEKLCEACLNKKAQNAKKGVGILGTVLGIVVCVIPFWKKK